MVRAAACASVPVIDECLCACVFVTVRLPFYPYSGFGLSGGQTAA